MNTPESTPDHAPTAARVPGAPLGPSTPTGDAAVALWMRVHQDLFDAGKINEPPTLAKAVYWTSDVPGTDSNWGE